jgi:hypothetical protein
MGQRRNWTGTANDCFGENDPVSNLVANGRYRCTAARQLKNMIFTVE